MKYIGKIILTTGLGNMLAMYDFVIYAIFAAILGQLFFLPENSFINLAASFGAFAAG